jgi:hypothetical protein
MKREGRSSEGRSVDVRKYESNRKLICGWFMGMSHSFENEKSHGLCPWL